ISNIIPINFKILDKSVLPIADTVQTFTAGSTLADLKVTGADLRWYSDPDRNNELDKTTILRDSLTYYVTQTENDHCESEPLGITVYEELGLNKTNFDRFKIAPNPVSHMLSIYNETSIDDVKVFDLSGKELIPKVDYGRHGALSVDFTQWSKGVYFLQVTAGHQTKTVQVIKN